MGRIKNVEVGQDTCQKYAAIMLRNAKPGEDDRDLYSGVIRLHVLYHAQRNRSSISGCSENWRGTGTASVRGRCTNPAWVEKRGYLRWTDMRDGKSLRKVHRATPRGRAALAAAKARELFAEVEGIERRL